MAIHRFQLADALPQPWKNGGGTTRELVCWPPGASMANFDWRVSIAHIASNGPFSVFPGVDRVITLLQGKGVALRSNDEWLTHKLDAPLRPFAFDGAASVSAELLGPDCHDFNVMTRREACTCAVQVLRSASTLPPSNQGLLFCVSGSWQVDNQKLGLTQGLWWQAENLPLQLTPSQEAAALIAVQIKRNT